MAVDQEVADGEIASIIEIDSCGRRRKGRRQPVVPRLLVDEVVLASKSLGERDRALVKAVYERGLPLKSIATISHTNVSRLHRRLRAVMQRVRSPLFRLVLREQDRWPADRRAIATAIVFQGRAQRDIADELGISVHRVRTEMEHLKALAGQSRVDAQA